MAFQETMSGIANMSSVYTKKWNNSGQWSGSGLYLGNFNGVINYRFSIFFTPSTYLSKVNVKLQATEYNNEYYLGSYYTLTEVSSGKVIIDDKYLGIWGVGSDNAVTMALDYTFEKGKEYELNICPKWDEWNYYVATNHNHLTITSTVATTYTVSYDANGGTGAPSAQTKISGVTLTLSSTKPTKSSSETNGYTVTFDANGGTTTKSSSTAVDTIKYAFNSWNTASDGSGTSYNAGGSYTGNAAITLYAQWKSSVVNGSVVLPTEYECIRDGYKLLGFSTDSNADKFSYTSGSNYTPSNDIVLYAVWISNDFICKKVDSSFLDSGLTSIADSIRNKTITSSSLLFPDGYANSIDSIFAYDTKDFHVVGGTTQPSNPENNTIWVNTSVSIPIVCVATGYPSSDVYKVNGAIFIWDNATSWISPNLNVSKEKSKMYLPIFPKAVYQYINGVWVSMTASIYKDKTWIPLGTYLYDSGNTCQNVTGGWTTSTLNTYQSNGMISSTANNTLQLKKNGKPSGSWPALGWVTNNYIDLNPYSSLHFKYVASGTATENSIIDFRVVGNTVGGYGDALAKKAITKNVNISGEVIVDISSIAGGRVMFCIIDSTYENNTFSLDVSKVYLS